MTADNITLPSGFAGKLSSLAFNEHTLAAVASDKTVQLYGVLVPEPPAAVPRTQHHGFKRYEERWDVVTVSQQNVITHP